MKFWGSLRGCNDMHPPEAVHWLFKSDVVSFHYEQRYPVRKWCIANPRRCETQYTFANLLAIIKRPRWRKARGLPPIEDDHG